VVVGRRGSSARAAALRRAQQAKAERDSERALRERQIEIALADYFEAAERIRRIRQDAQHKADAVLEAAAQAEQVPFAVAREAVGRLRELTGSNGEVAALCGLTNAAVREMLAQTRPASAQPGVPDGAVQHDG
jgi:hypothetical protein